MRPQSKLMLTLLTATALAACSQEKAADQDSPTGAGVAERASADAALSEQAGPGIGGTVAPGVAFTYAYSFVLPAKAISGVQQQHAAACERLGVRRCRVTGMRYEQPREDAVDARLEFLLAPDLAHRFVSEGIGAVERAEGTLDHATVNAENAGDAIIVSQQDSAAIVAEVERIEARLRAKGLASAERVELTRRVEDLRQQLRGQSAERRDQEAALASTPVSFAYASEGLLSGGNTFAKAAAASFSSVEAALAFVMLLAGIALPWIGLAALVTLGWRWLKRRTGVAAKPAQTA